MKKYFKEKKKKKKKRSSNADEVDLVFDVRRRRNIQMSAEIVVFSPIVDWPQSHTHAGPLLVDKKNKQKVYKGNE